MKSDSDDILKRAAQWHLASERSDMDWDGFTIWLEADPRHRTAYEEVALTDAAVAEHADLLAPTYPVKKLEERAANDIAPPGPAASRRWMAWSGGAIAASLVALAIAPQLQGTNPVTYSTQENSQMIALNDGSRIELAPHSQLIVDGTKQERLALDGGAWFNIRHDPSRPMVIRTGGASISDIGTSFDVQATANHLRVEVSEGKISLSSDILSKPVQLAAGRGFHLDRKAGKAVTLPVHSGNFGEWREGRLTFDGAPLSLVAADLARYAGVDIELAKGIKNRQFSGTLAIGDGEAAARDLAQLMGLELVRNGNAYRLDGSTR